MQLASRYDIKLATYFHRVIPRTPSAADHDVPLETVQSAHRLFRPGIVQDHRLTFSGI